MKKILNSFSSMAIISLLTFLFLLNSITPLDAQRRTYDSDKNPNTINLPTNQANPTKFGDIVGINEVGYVFWQQIYNSSTGETVNPTVVNSFKQTFPKMRLFHLMGKDYFGNTPATQPINPCTNPNYDIQRLGMCAIRDFYRVLRDDYPFIVSSVETIQGKGFPNKWYTESEWGGSMTNIKENAYQYAKAYLQTMDPDKNANTALVDRFHTSNEHWGSDLGIDGYKAVCDGFIEGFTEYYQGNRFATPNQNTWVIKMWFGAYQAHKAAHVWDNDYVGTMMSDKTRQTVAGLDIHPYSFAVENGVDNNNINQHPESTTSYFQSIKNMVKWRNDNAPTMGLTATEFGWNDQNVPIRMNLGDVDNKPGDDWVIQSVNGTPSTQPNNPSDWATEFVGVGEEAQALYSIRAFLLLARYGFDSGYIYGSFDSNESLYQNTGVYKTQPLIETVPGGAFKYSNYPSASSDFIGEKKVMPAMRKFRNSSVIGNKHYLQTIKEDDNGVHAILVGDSPNGNPTHLVAWYATNINNKNENQILADIISQTPGQIGLPSNLSINTSQNFTRLDWKESSVNNISSSSVYVNGTLKLTPIPIVIPLISNNNPSCNDGIQNQGETGLDCGGPCPTCPVGCNSPQQITLLAANASQSSNHSGIPNATADKAVDGNTNGAWNQISLTNWGSSEWWQVDLGQSYDIDQVKLWNVTTGNQGQMTNIYVFVSDNPFTSDDFETIKNSPNVDDYLISGQLGRPSTVNANSTGRYIRVQKQGQGFITLDEVQVFGCPASSCTVGADCDDGNPNTENDKYNSNCECIGTPIISATCNDGIQNQGETGVDCGGPCPACPGACNTPQQITLLAGNASQSSNHSGITSATADKAIDGNTNGAWNQVSLTDWGFNQWWQVDLGRSYDIDQVALWNVTTGNQGIMNNVYVFISDSPFTSDDFTTTKNDPNVDDYLISGQLGRPSTVNANSTGRYIRVQREGQGFITLDEVQVFGCPQQTCTVGASCDDGNPNTQNDMYNSNCECVGTIVSSGTCSAIDISTSGNTISINNLYNEHQIIKVFDSNGQVLDECNSYNGTDICKPSYSYTAPSAGTYQIQVQINGSQGEACNETETVQIGNGNKFAQLNDSQRLLIFPNPIKNNTPTLVLDSPEDEQLDIQIYNINSQLVHSQQASTVSGLNEITLDLQNARLASGVYFVKVISEKYTYGATRFVQP